MYVYFLYNTRTIITKYFLSHFELINSLLNIDLKKKNQTVYKLSVCYYMVKDRCYFIIQQ
jgi:hypothetical protein